MQYRINHIVIFHVQFLRGLVGLDTSTVKEEADRVGVLALTGAVGFHQLLQLGMLLNLENNLTAFLHPQFQ